MTPNELVLTFVGLHVCVQFVSRGSRGRAPSGVKKYPIKLTTFECADTQRRGKSEKFWIFWTKNSAEVEVDPTVFAIFCILG